MSEQQTEELDPLVRVWVANAIRTSRGHGPGWLELPRAEAGALVANRQASRQSPDDVLQRQIQSVAGLTRPR